MLPLSGLISLLHSLLSSNVPVSTPRDAITKHSNHFPLVVGTCIRRAVACHRRLTALLHQTHLRLMDQWFARDDTIATATSTTSSHWSRGEFKFVDDNADEDDEMISRNGMKISSIHPHAHLLFHSSIDVGIYLTSAFIAHA
jgi:hypothetical protein